MGRARKTKKATRKHHGKFHVSYERLCSREVSAVIGGMNSGSSARGVALMFYEASDEIK